MTGYNFWNLQIYAKIILQEAESPPYDGTNEKGGERGSRKWRGPPCTLIKHKYTILLLSPRLSLLVYAKRLFAALLLYRRWGMRALVAHSALCATPATLIEPLSARFSAPAIQSFFLALLTRDTRKRVTDGPILNFMGRIKISPPWS